MAHSLRLNGVEFEAREAQESGMIDVFLYSGASVVDLVLLDREPGNLTGVAMDRPAEKIQVAGTGRGGKGQARAAALTRWMDTVTDERMMQEALVYQTVTVGCE